MLNKGSVTMNLYNLLSKQITQDELLNYYNATIVYDNLPEKINGCTFNHKGINLIIINKELSSYKRKKTILHELAHIELNQLCQTDSLTDFKVEKYEDEADRYVKFLLESINND